MPIHPQEIIDLVTTLAEEENLRVTVKESVKGGIIAGVSVATGGLLLGPVGFLVGGLIGTIAAFNFSKKFLSVPEAIAAMTPEKKKRLVQKIGSIITNIGASDIMVLTSMMASDARLKNMIMHELVEFLRNEMSMAIVNP